MDLKFFEPTTLGALLTKGIDTHLVWYEDQWTPGIVQGDGSLLFIGDDCLEDGRPAEAYKDLPAVRIFVPEEAPIT